MSNSIDQALKFQQTALNLRAQRGQLLASNIANADTPRFKARDIDFKSALAQATSGRDGGTLALVTSRRGTCNRRHRCCRQTRSTAPNSNPASMAIP